MDKSATQEQRSNRATRHARGGRPHASRNRFTPISLRAWTWIPGAVTTVSISVFANLSFTFVAEKTLALLALALFAFHYLNGRTRQRIGHWEISGLAPLLRGERLLGCALPLAIALGAWFLPPSWLVLGSIAGLFFLIHTLYEIQQEKIFRRVKDSDKADCTSDFGQRRRDYVADHGEEPKHHLGLQRILVYLEGEPWLGVSRTRTVILNTMLFCVLLAGVAFADELIHKAEDSHHSPTNSARHGRAALAPAGGAAAVGDEPESTVQGPGAEDGEKAAPVDGCQVEPGEGAPAWAKEKLRALYYGHPRLHATAPPGTDAGGCPGPVIVPATPRGAFAYQIGRSPLGEVLSVAVVSKRFGPEIFLAPAAQRVIALIGEGIAPLGGYPRLNLVGGDLVSITTPEGTILLVRDEKHLPDEPHVAAPYVELPPAVATAFLEVLRERDGWLWPLSPVTSDGGEVFELTANSQLSSGKIEIHYDPTTGGAVRGPFDYRLPVPQLDEAALMRLAKRAR